VECAFEQLRQVNSENAFVVLRLHELREENSLLLIAIFEREIGFLLTEVFER